MTTEVKSIGHVVSHTHWDREWRYPLWTNRMFLLDFMDGLLATLDRDPAFACFVLDGQSVIIEDYLEIRPEHEDRIRAAVKAGRLSIGPWYTLPDLFPVDGECLVRNLLHGIRFCRRFGGHLGVGYNSFGWGQTAQFPQIYRQFGFDFVIAAKHVSRERAPTCEFLWEAPDGSRILTSRLGPFARANLFFHAWLPVRFGMAYASADYRYDWSRSGIVMHNATPQRCHEDHLKIADEPAYHPEQVEPGFRKAWDSLDETTVPACRLLLNGCDFTDCQPMVTRMVEDANARIGDIAFVHGRLEDYVADLRSRIDTDRLPVVRGELRDGPAEASSGNALATRMAIKMLNRQAQNELLRRAEPLASVMAMLGHEYPKAFLGIGWKALLQSHAHDSLNGVTQDKTADDTKNRLQQALEIGQMLHDRSVADLIQRIDLSSCEAHDVLLLAVNPTSRPVRAVCKLGIDTPREHNVWQFVLRDAEGHPHDVQPLSRQERTSPVHDPAARPWPFHHDRHMVYADLGELPAGGYKVFRVEPVANFDRSHQWWPATRRVGRTAISTSPRELENEHLHVRVESDGTFTLTHRKTGCVHRDLLTFEDGGDVGDYWVHYPPYEDRTHTSPGSPVRIWREENGPLAAVLAIEVTMTLPGGGLRPEAAVRGESRRRDDTRQLVITSRLRLTRGARRLEISTRVENTVEDHRLRVLFPTDIAATHSHASGHFTVDRRPVEPPGRVDEAYWPEMQTHPMQHFVDVGDGTQGLAILTDCLTEYEVLRDQRRTLAITLFRSMRNLICTEMRSGGEFPMQKGGQGLGVMEFTYALCPHEGTWQDADLYAEAEALNCPPSLYQTGAHDRGDLPRRRTLFSVEPPNLVLAALKRAEDRESWIVRVFNPTDDVLEGTVRVAATVREAWLVDLNEQRVGEAAVATDGAVRVRVPRGRILTLELLVDANRKTETQRA